MCEVDPFLHSRKGTNYFYLPSRGYHQASVAGAGAGPLNEPTDPVLNKRIANGEFLNTPSPPSCKVFIANVSVEVYMYATVMTLYHVYSSTICLCSEYMDCCH